MKKIFIETESAGEKSDITDIFNQNRELELLKYLPNFPSW